MTILKTGFESELIMDTLYFKDLVFTRESDDINTLELRIDFNKKVNKVNDMKYEVSLSVFLQDDDNKIKIALTANAQFSFQLAPDLSEDEIFEVTHINTIAIMFPYVRSQLSLLTTQPGLTPIMLPAINVNSLFGKN